jgi:hypothetical protein
MIKDIQEIGYRGVTSLGSLHYKFGITEWEHPLGSGQSHEVKRHVRRAKLWHLSTRAFLARFYVFLNCAGFEIGRTKRAATGNRMHFARRKTQRRSRNKANSFARRMNKPTYDVPLR